MYCSDNFPLALISKRFELTNWGWWHLKENSIQFQNLTNFNQIGASLQQIYTFKLADKLISKVVDVVYTWKYGGPCILNTIYANEMKLYV